MKVYFNLHYKTAQQEQLRAAVVVYDSKQILRKQIDLQSKDQAHWSGVLELKSGANYTLSYMYQVVCAKTLVRQEYNAVPRLVFLAADRNRYHLFDWWRDVPAGSWLYSTAFAPQTPAQPLHEYPASIILRVYIPGLEQGQKPYICGEQAYLGNWQVDKALPLVPAGTNEWKICLDASQIKLPLQYKFILKNTDGTVQWEKDGNRNLSGPLPQKGETYVYFALYPRFTLKPVRVAGTVIPLFSVRTKKDWGIGDFGSLKSLVDWAAVTGQKMIQLLPVNDTSLTGTWHDSYPYNSVSVYAFHPIYANMEDLPPLQTAKAKKFEKRRAKLNALRRVDYEAVLKLKLERLRLAYEQEGQSVLRSSAFGQFWNENALWLPVYAMFSALREQYKTANWHTWQQYSRFSEQDLRQFFAQPSQARETAYFYFYVQFILHNQLLQAHHYARGKAVGLKGDIPIGVSPFSADAWAAPHLFNLNAQAGAPPDDFSATGQNWGFPTYNWEEMAKDNYQWWRQRFAHMTRYFDAYRIDHVLGFFRIWEIPLHAVQGLLGQFSPALPLTEKEILKFGFDFKPQHLRPLITDEIVQKVFGSAAALVRKTYLVEIDDNYQLHERWNTQRKIEAAFQNKTKPQEVQLRDGLYSLCANVLFVPDRQQEQLFHPRIGALNSLAFQALPQLQRTAYIRLYNDYFYHRQDVFWKEQALQKLPALIQSTPMLCCAEDLGMIPHCVPEVMKKLQMLSLEIQRMPKQEGFAFAHTENYPYLSVATPSTHDMSVLRGWWRENPNLTQRFWNEILQRTGNAPDNIPVDACEQILTMHLQSPSMLCMIAWQDWASLHPSLHTKDPNAERINIPSNPNHYWRYRMHLPIEQLLQQSDFNTKLKNLITQANR